MRAVLTMAHGDRSNLKLVEDFPDPVPAEDEVVVRVAATALNYHDIFTRRGMPGIRLELPVIVGSDIAGEIVETGSAVTGWSVGDRVLIDPVYRDGKRSGMIGETAHGGRAELVSAPASQLIRVPDAVSLEDAASLPLGYGTAYRMMITRGQIAAGEKVLILGASGGVGVACVQLAKLYGAEVVACASSQSKIERLRQLGADHVIDYSKQAILDGIREIYGKPRTNGDGGVDVAINFTGGDTWVETQKCVKKHGRIITCGATAGYEMMTDARYLWTYEHHMLGSNGWSPADLEALLALIESGRLKPVIDKVFPLEEIDEAERLLEDREVFGKVIMRP
ncbi:zinc-binding dehydrogenase [Sphingopyxis sp.]|uniref:zinc-binding dehydrogenase n=1 Tax=Sphingopyxis sp. TaxID=1908224 RepID=UPI003D6C9E2D